MMLKKILDTDTLNCYEAMKNDAKLKEVEGKVYSLLSTLPDGIKFDIERSMSEYMARVTRIAYLQGIVDFTRLHVVLQEEPNAILKKYVDEMK